MFDNICFLSDLFHYCDSHSIDYGSLTYTEQLSVMRSMLVYTSRSVHIRFRQKNGILQKK